MCKGPIKVKNLKPVEQDIAHMKEALSKVKVTEGFMNAVSPGTIAVFQPNEYYPSHETYLEALANAMREEYELIVKSGLLLQLDCPDLAMGRHTRFKNLSDEEFLRYAELQVEALNHALANVPADRVRLHVCWGNYEGTHINDMDCMKIFPIAIKVKPMALLIEGANPRHEHEWEAWTRIKLPDDKILIPGVVASSSNYVEHPEVVAQRLLRYAGVVGRERSHRRHGLRLRNFRGIRPGLSGFRVDEAAFAGRGGADRVEEIVGPRELAARDIFLRG